MEDRFLILLKNLKIEQSTDELKNGKIDKVVVAKDNSYIFYLSFEHMLPFSEFQLLITNREHFPYPVSYHLTYQDDNYDQEQLSLYIGYVLEQLKQEYPVCATLTIDSIKVENKIKIETCNEIQLEQLKQLNSQITKMFSRIGINKNCEYFIDENNNTFKNIQAEMENPELPVIEKPKEVKTKPVSQDNNYYRNNSRQKNNAISLRIEEITNQTMENNIVITGYVFKTDLIKIKSGKHIQSLWVTDYTDSIIVKRFENNSKNTLEELKLVGKGGIWVKVRGEVRFDSYSKETVMMARDLEIIKGPASRQDKAEVKRVELHTHSKMSTMDGISTISQYVQTAAYMELNLI